MSNSEITREIRYHDGQIELKESYLSGELDLVTLVDSRDRTVSQVYGDRCVSVKFIFSVIEDKIEISRIFADTPKGGYALDSRSSLLTKYRVKTYSDRRLLKGDGIDILKEEYPDKRIDLRRFRDVMRDVFQTLCS